ncbi:molybdenum cofactor biosysynthesis protein [Streptomonospora alba]|uniref:Molybdenum cofactor biosysynthesis protein n=1 Tax=Streptomonospora alba TaxID=183763 RepID=A0A0C2J5Z7_9ACTN|nr:MOSC domain-containing protein [Streptomonospora alba]KIH96836.1 molybdenum cofactor biosysynthesis protein [Streptomonospora alba]
MAARVAAVGLSSEHAFSKTAAESVRLLEGLGVEGDAHMGATVQHRSRVARDPTQPNLRQVHLIPGELHDELRESGYRVRPGDLGENVTTRGLDLLALPTGTLLDLGPSAVVEITGLRNPCTQIDGFQQGLLAEVVGRDADGAVVLKAGVMGVVRATGPVRPGDAIGVRAPAPPHSPLRRV